MCVSSDRGHISAMDKTKREKIMQLSDGVDFVTQDLVIKILGDEQEHRRAFVGFLTEFERRR